MRRYLGYIGLTLALLVPAVARTQVFDQRTYPLAVAWDMDGEAADADQVVVSTPVTDSYTYPIAAQPDACRLLDATFTDADSSITAGTMTVTGTDCYGDALVATYSMSSPIGGVQSFTVGTVSTTNGENLASGAYFSSVTSIVTGAVTGEGGAGDTVTVGYSGTGTFYQYPMLGHVQYIQAPPYRYVQLGFKPAGRGVTITASGTTWTASGGAGFTGLNAGSLIAVNMPDGTRVETRVVTYTSSTSIVVADTIPFPTAGVKGFEFARKLVSSDPQDGWFAVGGFDAGFFIYDVDALASSTGATSLIQCVPRGHTGDFDDFAISVDTDNVLTGATGNAVTAIDLRLAPYGYCRAGVTFDTGDDADAANEDINLSVSLRR